MNSIWLPDRKIGKTKKLIFDSSQVDIDQQASLYTNINVYHIQLSSGKFSGRVFSADLGRLSIYIESHNQMVEKQISVPPSSYCFLMASEEGSPFYACGIEMTRKRVYVIPPGGGSVVVCPADSNLMVLTVNRNALIFNDSLVVDAREWLQGLDRRGGILESEQLAERLRSHIASALESISQSTAIDAREIVGRATIFSIASALTMEALQTKPFDTLQRPVSFERFWRARKLLLDNLRTAKECGLQSLSGLGSRRSTEQAFSEHVFMGPLSYYRVVRLHDVRRKLMQKGRLGQSIGDIASEEGFWDWSRFSTYYRRHFGELPSETRGRVVGKA